MLYSVLRVRFNNKYRRSGSWGFESDNSIVRRTTEKLHVSSCSKWSGALIFVWYRQSISISTMNKRIMSKTHSSLTRGKAITVDTLAYSALTRNKLGRQRHSEGVRGIGQPPVITTLTRKYAPISKIFYDCLLNIWTNYFAAGSCWSEQLCSRALMHYIFTCTDLKRSHNDCNTW